MNYHFNNLMVEKRESGIMESIKSSATIAQLEETVLQETKTAEDFQALADKQPMRRQEFKEYAALALDNKENAELTIKVIKESAQYTEFGKG